MVGKRRNGLSFFWPAVQNDAAVTNFEVTFSSVRYQNRKVSVSIGSNENLVPVHGGSASWPGQHRACCLKRIAGIGLHAHDAVNGHV